jgi:hypothetical protein
VPHRVGLTVAGALDRASQQLAAEIRHLKSSWRPPGTSRR